MTVAQDGADSILGRSDLGLFVAVPRPGAVFIEALQGGASISVATEQASDAAGEEVDAVDFLTGLREAGLLDSPEDADSASPVGARVGWVDRIPQAAVRPLFGRVAWTLYAAAAVVAIGILLFRSDLRPIFDDIWFLSDPIWSMLALFIVSMIITAGHEFWHWLAGRALGVTPRFRVSRRGVILVFESDLSPLVTLPRRARYSPLLAGYAFDVALLAIALVLRLAYREDILGVSPGLDRFLGAVVFRQLVVVVWQMSGVAFRSDTYAVFANALGCHNLFRATTLTVKRGVLRLNVAEARELAEIGPRDRATARWFWLVYIAGAIFMFWVLFEYLVPFTYGMLAWIVPNLTSLAVGTFVFWQSLALVTLFVAQFAIIPVIARRERRQGRVPARRVAMTAADSEKVTSPDSKAWRVLAVVLLVGALAFVGNSIKKYIVPSVDATATNAAAQAQDTSCLPGEQITIQDFPHISLEAAAGVRYNTNPPTSGPHFGAALAPGIYDDYLPPGLTVHAMEHGRVVIHYRPDTPAAVVEELAGIARQFARDTVMHPNPEIDTPLALTSWGRIQTLDSYDMAQVEAFVDQLRNRYNHASTVAANECRAAG